jgi:hypothetical protein
MKAIRILFFSLLLAVAFNISANAQVIKVGVGNEIRKDPSISMFAKVTYDMEFIDPNMATSADLIFLPGFSGNIDLHYSFLNKEKFHAYGLTGVSFSKTSGFNLGGGVKLPLSEELDIFGEAKYIFKYNPEPTLKFGVLYNL